MEKTLT
ncbi:hypothetical protein NXF25_008451 [Crotalus adamanteus]